MASKRVQFLRYDKQKNSCKKCFHDCVCPHLRDDDAEKCGAYITDVAPVEHGRWIEGEYGDPDRTLTCSRCGFENDSVDYNAPKFTSRKYPYCPDCGAKMDGKENE